MSYLFPSSLEQKHCVVKRLCKFDAAAWEFLSFSRHCSCLRELRKQTQWDLVTYLVILTRVEVMWAIIALRVKVAQQPPISLKRSHLVILFCAISYNTSVIKIKINVPAMFSLIFQTDWDTFGLVVENVTSVDVTGLICSPLLLMAGSGLPVVAGFLQRTSVTIVNGHLLEVNSQFIHYRPVIMSQKVTPW